MTNLVIRGLFDGLVRRAGGVEAVAAVLEARYGVGSKGTVSKMCAGQIGVTVNAAVAVEDFVGAYPITNRMFERTSQHPDPVNNLQELAAKSTMASGAAHSALIRAFSPLSSDPDNLTPKERADVISEMREARRILTEIINSAEAAGKKS